MLYVAFGNGPFIRTSAEIFVTSALRSHPPVGKIDFCGNLAYLDFSRDLNYFPLEKYL